MNRTAWGVRVFAGVAVGVSLLTGAAAADAQGVPSPANSTAPANIALMGSLSGVPGPQGTFEVIIRDLANNPVGGAKVVVDLSGAWDLFVCAAPLDPEATVDCVHARVSKHTDLTGRVRFTLVGGSIGSTPSHSPHNYGAIYWEGQLIARPTVAAYDLDGAGGVGANDLAIWLEDFGSQQDIERGDYDGSGALGANDLSLWLQTYGSLTNLESCATHCP